MLDLATLASTNPIHQPAWTHVARRIGSAMFRFPSRTRLVLEGAENLPEGPSVISPNHTHKFDFFPIRHVLFDHGAYLMTWIKARDYSSRPTAAALSRLGNIPLASRGWIIAADFAVTRGRAPDEEEYRVLRDHVDHGAEADEALLARLSGPRTILGTTANPAERSYAAAIRQSYYEFMCETLRLGAIGRDAGRHQHIYPQGATSRQLTPGKIGAVQAAIALGLPIVPVGISGCREAFRGSSPFTRGGRIVVRIGPPLEVPREVVPPGFRAFHPDDEDVHRDVLDSWTRELMGRINSLCDPQYQWAPDLTSDAKQGVGRFFK